MKTQHQVQGKSFQYEHEMDAGEAAIDRATRRAFAYADEAFTSGTWEVVDNTVKRVVRSGLTTYHAVLTVEVDHG